MLKIRTLYDARTYKRFVRLLALLLALALSAQELLAQNSDQGGNQDHGPDLTGVWTQIAPDGHIWLVTFHADGTAIVDQQGDVVFNPVQSTQQGLWKKVAARTFISSLLQLEYNTDASLYGTAKIQTRYTLYPSGDQYDCTLVATETLSDGTVNHYGPFQFHAVRLTLEAPPL
jgi:hypothetical protein